MSNPFGMLAEIEVQDLGWGGDFKSLGMKMMFDMSDIPVSRTVDGFGHGKQDCQHVLIGLVVTSDGTPLCHFLRATQGRIYLQEDLGRHTVILETSEMITPCTGVESRTDDTKNTRRRYQTQ